MMSTVIIRLTERSNHTYKLSQAGIAPSLGIEIFVEATFHVQSFSSGQCSLYHAFSACSASPSISELLLLPSTESQEGTTVRWQRSSKEDAPDQGALQWKEMTQEMPQSVALAVQEKLFGPPRDRGCMSGTFGKGECLAQHGKGSYLCIIILDDLFIWVTSCVTPACFRVAYYVTQLPAAFSDKEYFSLDTSRTLIPPPFLNLIIHTYYLLIPNQVT